MSRRASCINVICILCADVQAQIVVSANDAKVRLVDGVNTTVPNAPPDTVTIIDLSRGQPRIVAEIPVPNSVVGPPQNVAITPDESLALVASSTQVDPADASKTTPDDKLTVIDLRASPPAVSPRSAPETGRPASRSTARAPWRSWPIASKARSRCSRSPARPSPRRARSRWGRPRAC